MRKHPLFLTSGSLKTIPTTLWQTLPEKGMEVRLAQSLLASNENFCAIATDSRRHPLRYRDIRSAVFIKNAYSFLGVGVGRVCQHPFRILIMPDIVWHRVPHTVSSRWSPLMQASTKSSISGSFEMYLGSRPRAVARACMTSSFVFIRTHYNLAHLMKKV